MTVTVRGEAYECRTAIQKGNKLVLYLGKFDEYGRELTSVFAGYSEEDIVGFAYEKEPTTDEILNALLGVTE